MKVLHIWDTAGVASILAKYMDKLYNTSSKVIMRSYFDKFNQTTYGERWDCSAKIFGFRAFLLSRKFDIIHVHALDEIIPFLRIYKKPLILHYHGSDIRGGWDEKRSIWSKADAIIISTKDLLEGAPDNVIYLPNPIDLELFYDRNIRVKGTAFHISYNADDKAREIARELNLKLTIHDRDKEPIPYQSMPEILSRYEYYIDIKGDKNGNIYQAISKTGLEALACGCKVVTYNGRILDKLPEEHKPQTVVKRLTEIYKNIIE